MSPVIMCSTPVVLVPSQLTSGVMDVCHIAASEAVSDDYDYPPVAYVTELSDVPMVGFSSSSAETTIVLTSSAVPTAVPDITVEPSSVSAAVSVAVSEAVAASVVFVQLIPRHLLLY